MNLPVVHSPNCNSQCWAWPNPGGRNSPHVSRRAGPQCLRQQLLPHQEAELWGLQPGTLRSKTVIPSDKITAIFTGYSMCCFGSGEGRVLIQVQISKFQILIHVL